MTLRQTRRYGAALTMLCAAASAAAQVDGQAAWLWEVKTQDGDAIVEPGETATVTLSIDMEPDVGEEMVLGFAGADWNVFGSTNATKGMIGEFGILGELFALPGETDGVNIFGLGAGQFQLDLFSDDDPIKVMFFEWIPEVPGSYQVGYSTETITGSDQQQVIGVHVGEELFSDSEIEFWPIEEAAISFQVVPAPGGVFVTGASAFILAGRRKRRRD